MATRQRIVRVRREYNQWVANQTLEDYALRFTAKSARRWSGARVAMTALGGISFLALEAIGGTVTVAYGSTNAIAAILASCVVIFAICVPISYHAARAGVDIDLLTRGAGFGYIGSTITSLIYAAFTFIFFAIESVILASTLADVFGLPPAIGYLICSIAIVPLVTHGVTFISRIQLWSQPVWLALQCAPFVAIGLGTTGAFGRWTDYPGTVAAADGSFDLLLFGAAASVVFSLVAQIGEQVDYLRFLPPRKDPGANGRWWCALLAGGPGWIVIGMLKLLAGSFLATLAIDQGVADALAAHPAEMYRAAFGFVTHTPGGALALAACFVVVSQVKINVTNAYAGSIAWSNFFSRLTHSHPGRVVWLVFNIAIALLLMELGIYQAIEHTLVVYSIVAAAWVGALVADLVVNKPLGLSPAHIEFKRAHLYDINPVGTGAMLLAVAAAMAAYTGLVGALAQAVSPFVAFATAFAAAPLIAWATGGRYYLARKSRPHWASQGSRQCVICENAFEPEDMAYCPVYAGAICSLCCSLDARCHDICKPAARFGSQLAVPLRAIMPAPLTGPAATRAARYACVFILLAGILALTLGAIYARTATGTAMEASSLAEAFRTSFFLLFPVVGVVAWLLVLAQDARRFANEERRNQTSLLLAEIDAHRRTDAQLQKAKEAAEAANLAKSRYVVGISHELRSPLNAILGYAQLLERDARIEPKLRGNIGIIRRSGEHLAALIDGLLDIAKIEAGRIELYRDKVQLIEFSEQLVNMFRLQAEAKGLEFHFIRSERCPNVVYTDERRLRQILINLLSNAIKFTPQGSVSLKLTWRNDIAEFEIADTGVGIAPENLARIFEPFERIEQARADAVSGIGLGLTITKLLTQIMGGELTLGSVPGQGSWFRVRLMLSAAEQTRSPAPLEQRVQGFRGRRITVLIADDDPVHRGLLQDLLSPLGFILFVAQTGPDCIAMAAECQPDLLLVDISMPGCDGWEVARRLRAAGFERLVIIVVSAHAGALQRPRVPAPDHDDILVKPIDIPLILTKISTHLGLEWTDRADDADRVDGSPEHDAPSVPVNHSLLAPEYVATLRELGAIGYVSGIHAQLDRIECEAPDEREQVGRLRQLVVDFRLDAFMDALGPPR